MEDDDELDENDPALEELGLSLAPKSNKEKKKVGSLLACIHPHLERKKHNVHAINGHITNVATFCLLLLCIFSSRGEKAK